MAVDLQGQSPIANGPRSPWTIDSSDYSLTGRGEATWLINSRWPHVMFPVLSCPIA